MRRRLELEREEEIRNHVKMKMSCMKWKQYGKVIDWKGTEKNSCEK